MNFDVDLVLRATEGKLISGPRCEFKGVGTDSREDLTGKLFVPLQGENFDGHNFIEAAIQKGAIGFISHFDFPNKKFPSNITHIHVDDTLNALQNIATLVRKKWAGPIVAITGSNGKTTTKTYLHQMLSSWHKSHSNQGSFNNHWGVPLTLIDVPADAKSAVVEMGMNHEGEITNLCKIANPDFVGVLNVGRAHLGHFKNEQEIAQAKAEIYETKNLKGQIFNLDNVYTLKMFEKYKSNSKFKTCSTQNEMADVCLKGEWSPDGLKVTGHIGVTRGTQLVSVWGMQNISNLSFASTACLMMGMPEDKIWQSLSVVRESWGRNQWLDHQGAKILFDGYNANPESYKALFENLKSFAQQSKQKLVGVFGDMREMGEFSEAVHRELAAAIAKLPFEAIFYVGDMHALVKDELGRNGFKGNLNTTPKHNMEFSKSVESFINSTSVTIFKASRGIKIEQILMDLGIKIYK